MKQRVLGYFVHWVDQWDEHYATNHKIFRTEKLAQDYLDLLAYSDGRQKHPTTTLHLEIRVAYK